MYFCKYMQHKNSCFFEMTTKFHEKQNMGLDSTPSKCNKSYIYILFIA